MRKLVSLLFWLVMCLPSWAALTTVSDTLYNSAGGLANGTITVSWPTFYSSDGHLNQAGSLTITVTNGALSQALEPTDTGSLTPGGPPGGIVYTANYAILTGPYLREFWNVPTSGSPQPLANVRALTLPPGTSVIPNIQQITNTFNLSGQPSVVSSSFTFSVSPGGSLSGGSNTITLNSGIPGVGGADTKHYVYVSGGTGTPEACLITGGTAPLGGTGTLVLSCSGSHTGAWTIQSANCGVNEAENSLPVGSTSPVSALGTVIIPAGVCTVNGAIPLHRGVRLAGLGSRATILSAGASTSILLDFDVPTGSITTSADTITIQDLQLDGSGFASNTIVPMRELLPDGTAQTGLNGLLVSDVIFNNAGKLTIHRGRNVTFSYIQAYANTQFAFTTPNPTTDTPNINTFETYIDHFQYYPYCQQGQSTCTSTLGAVPIIDCVHCETFKLTNSDGDGPGGATGPIMLFVEGASEDILVSGTTCVTWRRCVQLVAVTNNGQAFNPSFVTLTGNTFSNTYDYAFVTPVGTSNAANFSSRNLIFTENECSNPNTAGGAQVAGCINFQAYTHDVIVANNRINNASASPAQTMITTGANVDTITFANNKFNSDGASFTGGASTGIFVSTTATNIDYSVGNTCNFYDICINDTAATALASAATLTLPGRGPFSVYTITGNTTITTINTCGTAQKNYVATLMFGSGGPAVTKGNNIHITSSYAGSTTDGLLSLRCNGSNWLETGRSVN